MAAAPISKARAEGSGSRRSRGRPSAATREDYEALVKAIKEHRAHCYDVTKAGNGARHDRILYRVLHEIEQRRKRR